MGEEKEFLSVFLKKKLQRSEDSSPQKSVLTVHVRCSLRCWSSYDINAWWLIIGRKRYYSLLFSHMQFLLLGAGSPTVDVISSDAHRRIDTPASASHHHGSRVNAKRSSLCWYIMLLFIHINIHINPSYNNIYKYIHKYNYIIGFPLRTLTHPSTTPAHNHISIALPNAINDRSIIAHCNSGKNATEIAFKRKCRHTHAHACTHACAYIREQRAPSQSWAPLRQMQTCKC